jgi:hypothetical protein
MRRRARVVKAAAAVLVTFGVVLAGGSAAAADERPKPPTMRMVDAAVEGCEAPCAPDESGVVTVRFAPPSPGPDIPQSATPAIRVQADGAGFHPYALDETGDLWVYKFRICADNGPEPYPCVYQRLTDLRGTESFTVQVGYAWDCDPITAECRGLSQVSDPSNAVVPVQR